MELILEKSNQAWTTGFWLHPQEQGKGYMTESVKAILELGFEVLGVKKIESYHAL